MEETQSPVMHLRKVGAGSDGFAIVLRKKVNGREGLSVCWVGSTIEMLNILPSLPDFLMLPPVYGMMPEKQRERERVGEEEAGVVGREREREKVMKNEV